MVAPSGTVKDDIFFYIKTFSRLFSVMGMVAPLLEVEKANNNAVNPAKKLAILVFAINLTNGR